MSAPRTLDIAVHPDDADEDGVRRAVARELGIAPDRIGWFEIQRRTIDARHGRVRVRYRVALTPDGQPEAPAVAENLPRLEGPPVAIIIGAGPAGLFAAWELARRGQRAVLFDRGSDVRGRRPHLARLNREGVLNPDSNYCFGEGGAGTYSDGKLYTRSRKRGSVDAILRILVQCGAPPEIQVEARPHIGTNRLPRVVSTMREALLAAGVLIEFDTRVDDLILDGQQVVGVRLADGRQVRAPATILVTGHSARDIYSMLAGHRVAMAAKPFALGVRVEHPQPIIDRIQYGSLGGHPNLGAAPYALKHTEDDIGVYSFCMCPGGFIVAAATEDDGVVVNGMSPSKRNSRYANSGMVVSVGPETFGPGLLDGIAYQRRIEQAAFAVGGGAFRAPAQRIPDFLAGRTSADLPDCSYRPGLESADLRRALPPRIAEPLARALKAFEHSQMRGYVTDEAVMVGVESRSSAPVRVERDRTSLQSPSHPGLFPGGEGAGYAGGIISAAIDGRRLAEAVDRFVSGA